MGLRTAGREREGLAKKMKGARRTGRQQRGGRETDKRGGGGEGLGGRVVSGAGGAKGLWSLRWRCGRSGGAEWWCAAQTKKETLAGGAGQQGSHD